MEGFGILFFIILILFFIGIGIAFYVMMSLGLYTIAKNNGYEDKAVLAWIPIANIYLLCLMSGGANVFKKYEIDGHTLGLLLVILPFTIIIPVVGLFSIIATLILSVYAYLNFFKRIDEESAGIMTVIIFVFNPALPIYLFIKRDAILSDYNNYSNYYNSGNEIPYDNNNDGYNSEQNDRYNDEENDRYTK